MQGKVYSFRYVPAYSKVYYVGRRGTTHRSTGVAVYTEPFYSRETNETRNALYAYCNEAAAEYKRTEVVEGEVMTESVEELKYLSALLRMPLVVEVTSHCDIANKGVERIEVFYCNKI